MLWSVLILAAVAEWAFAHHARGAPWWQTLPGVQAVYGIVGCVAIVRLSKWLGRAWLQRPESDSAAGDRRDVAHAKGRARR